MGIVFSKELDVFLSSINDDKDINTLMLLDYFSENNNVLFELDVHEIAVFINDQFKDAKQLTKEDLSQKIRSLCSYLVKMLRK